MEETCKLRLADLEDTVSAIKRRIEKYPSDNLKVKKEKSGFYYCLIDKDTGTLKYIKKEEINKARIIAQRDYDLDYLRLAEKEIKDIKRLLSGGYTKLMENCYSGSNEGRKKLIIPYEMSAEDYIWKWVTKEYIAKNFKEDDYSAYYTEKGERVRSKSEVIIANLLNSMQIPYKYECPLQLGQVTIYPDFTLLDVRTKKEKYLEHFGMMGDSEYVADMMNRINIYEQNGIYFGTDLICTFESVKRPLNIGTLKKKINAIMKNSLS